MKRIKLFCLFIFLLNSLSGSAQKAELFGMLGTSHFLGDLGGKLTLGTNDFSDLDLPTTRYGLGVGLRLRPVVQFALRTSFIFGKVAGDDKFTVNKERRDRNLSFFSNVWEANVAMELYLGRAKRTYLFGGVGYAHFNPKTRYLGNVYELQPMGTEGQNFLPGATPYSLYTLTFPIGIGHRFLQLKNGDVLGFEINSRITRTDYIDDVHGRYADKSLIAASKGQIAADLSDRAIQNIPGISETGAIRGNPNNRDNFFFLFLTYNHKLGDQRGGSDFGNQVKKKRNRYNSKRRCPEFY